MIDLRSDTVTKPTRPMLDAMMRAHVGDDIYGEDPSVIKLQEFVADLLGKEAALFTPSGTMANQICLNVLTIPGDEVICEKDAHIYHFESGALAKLSGIQVRQIEGKHGVFTVADVDNARRPPAHYYPKTTVIALENTHNVAGGTIFPLEEMQRIGKFAHKNGLKMHLDGARIWNASVATGIKIKTYAENFDSVSVCLSKGLGAPIGSVVAGSKAFIAEALRCRKQFGGAMRQVGYLAAAGIYAIENNLALLAEDHKKAKQFAQIITQASGVEMDTGTVHTNIIMFNCTAKYNAYAAAEALRKKGVLLNALGKQTMRAVTHLDVTSEQVQQAAEIIAGYFE